MNTTPVKTLTFNPQRFGLQDSAGHFVSLAEVSNRSPLAEEKKFWQGLPWSDAEFSEVQLMDLPCRLEGPSLALALQKVWQLCLDDAIVKVSFPHPRHDLFLKDLGYVRGILPETLAQLDPRDSKTGLAKQLGVRFEVLETALQLDPRWQQVVDDGEMTYDEIQVVSSQALNVVQWINMRLQVKKSLWQETGVGPLTDDMKKQFQKQLDDCIARGDEKSAAVIRSFLKKEGQ